MPPRTCAEQDARRQIRRDFLISLIINLAIGGLGIALGWMAKGVIG